MYITVVGNNTRMKLIFDNETTQLFKGQLWKPGVITAYGKYYDMAYIHNLCCPWQPGDDMTKAKSPPSRYARTVQD